MTLAFAAFLAALVGSPHCLGMCGPFALACGRSVAPSAAWHGGRITTYMVLGGLAGAFGSMLMAPFSSWVATAVSAVLVAWFAAVLAGAAPEPKWTPPFLARVANRWLAPREDGQGSALGSPHAYLFGLANGLLPCGLVYAALGLAVAGTGPLLGAIVMGAFGLGTVPALSALMVGGHRLPLRTLTGRRIMAALVLVTGLASIAMRRVMHAGH